MATFRPSFTGDKPLPEEPLSKSIHALSVDHRKHFGNLVASCVECEDLPASWTKSIEHAVDQMAMEMFNEDWLVGLKRSVAQRVRLAEADIQTRSDDLKREAEKEKEKSGERGKGKRNDEDKDKGRGKGKSDFGEVQTHEREASEAFSNATKALADLRQRRRGPAGADSNSTYHLLLCLQISSPRSHHRSSIFSSFDAKVSELDPNLNFQSGYFSIPQSLSEDSSFTTVLYGLDEWKESFIQSSNPYLVGGTFLMKTSSPRIHQAIVNILRITIYCRLSMILEQLFLYDIGYRMQFPAPPAPSLLQSVSLRKVASLRSSPETAGLTYSRMDSGGTLREQLWSFVTSKTDRLLNGSLLGVHLPRQSLDVFPRSNSINFTAARHSEDSQLSFKDLPPIPQIAQDINTVPTMLPPFRQTVERLRNNLHLLSTSPSVSFAVPPLIQSLSEKEEVDRNRRLRGDERVALETILGWEGRESRGRGMVGPVGFARHQQITVLFSSSIPDSSSDKGQKNSLAPTSLRSPCLKAHERSFRYFSPNAEEDISLGGIVEILCHRATGRCEHRVTCSHIVGQHHFEWIHAGVKVQAVLSPHPFIEGIQMWRGCTLCENTSKPTSMNDGTYVLSFGKFIELQVYDSRLRQSPGTVCQHTEEDHTKVTHHFAHREHVVSFTRASTSIVLDVQIPWLQFEKSERPNKVGSPLALPDNEDIFHQRFATVTGPVNDDVALLTREITEWFEGLRLHMRKVSDTLELFECGNFFNDDTQTSHTSTSIRQPSNEMADENIPTPKPRLASLPASQESLATRESLNTPSSSEVTGSDQSTEVAALDKLQKLDKQSHKRQRDLLELLRSTPLTHLNDVRRKFKAEANQSKRALESWLNKHFKPLNLANGQHLMQIQLLVPDWWDPSCHAIPGSRYLVKDGDWGTMIASTLGSAEYCKELASMTNLSSRHVSLARPSLGLPAISQSDPGSPAGHTMTFASSPASSLTSLSSLDLPGLPLSDLFSHSRDKPSESTIGADTEGEIASSPEEYTTSVSRREHPRELSSALNLLTVSLRSPDITRRSAQDSSTYSRFSSISEAATRLISPKPPSAPSSSYSAQLASAARARAAAVELNVEVVGGESSRRMTTDLTNRLMAQAQTSSNMPRAAPSKLTDQSAPVNLPDESLPISSVFMSSISRSDNASVVSSIEPRLNDQIPPSIPQITDRELPSPPPLSSKDESDNLYPITTPPLKTESQGDQLHVPKRSVEHPGISPSKRHALLALTEAQPSSIDPKPHIRYEWTVGTRLKFSCTVYYAQQFDSLRSRCGVGEILPQSLAATDIWIVEGGKSRSSFWKTRDNRFIIKTLVNSWNVADLQVLIDIAPAYFRYMDHTSSHASVLAKLMGFYTVEMSNLVSGDRTVVNLLVMENLFFNHRIARRFDLKGIAGRKAKGGEKEESASKTLLDSEWVEAQKHNPTLINTHSHAVLQQAVRADAEFLTKNFIMDYSLLLGLDDERHQLVCGLVDTIGNFSLAKTLEWKLKQGINSGLNSGSKETTVLPPQDYHERFVKAIESYFLACPDKWSKPVGNVNTYSVEDLPSVL